MEEGREEEMFGKLVIKLGEVSSESQTSPDYTVRTHDKPSQSDRKIV